MESVMFYKAFDGKIFDTKEKCLEYEASQKPYTVDFYFDGFIRVHVRAKSREESIEIAKNDFYCEDIDFNLLEDKTEVFEGEQ